MTARTDTIKELLQTNATLLRELQLAYGVNEAPAHKAYKTAIRSPEDVVALCGSMGSLRQEQLRVLCLNTKQEVLNIVTVYQGTVNSANTRVSEILRPAILENAPGIIVVHNHPSGDPTPSSADWEVNRKILAAANLLDITFQDHVIIAEGCHFSMSLTGVGGF